MKHGRTLVLCLGTAFLLLLSGQSLAGKEYTYAPDPGREIYFGHISYTEIFDDTQDPVVYRPGETSPEKAVLNLPLAPGDVILTSSERRCEIQFDSGTLIRLDTDTQLRIETILAESLTSGKKLSNLVLEKGRIYVMYKRYNRPEIFQVKTAPASFKLDHNSVSIIHAGPSFPSDVWVEEGKVYVLYGSSAKMEDLKLKRSDRMRIAYGREPEVLAEPPEKGFQAWNRKMNQDFVEMHRYQTMLPKPVQRYSDAVTYFAQKYSMVYGEWHYHDLLGYVWQPHMNNTYPGTPWRPMVFGYWGEVSGQLFWIPEEPWGWVPYHLGVWHWDKNKGWLWIPGSAFAPAWVQWDFFFGGSLFAWHPLSIYAWFPHNLRGAWAHEHIDQELRLEYLWASQGNRYNPAGDKYPLPAPKYPLPDSLKGTLKKVQKAFDKQDPGLMESIRTTPSSLNVVRRSDLNSPQIREKLIEPRQIPGFEKNGRGIFRDTDDAARAAARAHFANRLKSQVRQRVADSSRYRTVRIAFEGLQPVELDSHVFDGKRSFDRKPDMGGRVPGIPTQAPAMRVPARTATHYLDWNPDVQRARQVGVSIRYVSEENRVHSPRLASSLESAARQRRSTNRDAGSGVISGDNDRYFGTNSGISDSGISGGSTGSSGSSSSSSSSSGSKSTSSGTGSSSGRSSSTGKK
jgi:hypothetical protein